MGLSILSKFIASLLAVTLFGVIMSATVDSTLLNSHYLESRLAATNSYSKLSSAIPAELAKDAGTADPTLVAQVQSIITPAVLQQKLNSALDQLQAYYKGNGTAAPTVDISDLVAKAQAAGLQVPADSPLNKPIVLTGNAKVKDAGQKFEGIKLKSIILSVVLVAALLAISWERHKFGALPDVAIVLGVLVGLMALVFTIGPGILDSHLKFDFASNAFGGVAHDLAIDLAKNVGKRLGIIALILLVGGVISRIFVARLHPTPAAQAASVQSKKPASIKK